MNKNSDKAKEQLIAELTALRKKSKQQEDKLKTDNQQLDAQNQQLQATEQQLRVVHQQLQETSRQKLLAANQQLQASNQQLRATEQQLRAANQQLNANNQQLLSSETRMRNLFNAMQDLVFEMDYNGTYLNIAPTSSHLLVKPVEKINGKTLHEVFPKSQADLFLQSIQKCINENKPEKIIYPVKFENKTRWFEGRVNPIGNKRVLFIASDITKRKQAEQELQESEAFRRQVFDSSQLPIVVIDADTFRYIDCNPAAIEIYGYTSKEQVLGLTAEDVSAPFQYDGSASSEKALFYNEKAKAGEPVVFEWKHQRPDGTIWDAEVHLLSFSVSNRSLLQFTLVDITKRKQAEEELLKLQAAGTQSPVAIVITNTDRKVEYVNPKFTEITGYSREEVIGQNPRLLKPSEHPSEMYKSLWETISSGKTWRRKFQTTKKNGELYWESASVSPIFDKQGNIINYVKIAEDITDRKQAEDNFKHSIDESPLGIRIVNRAGKTIYVNKALLDIYEFSSLNEFNDTKAIDRYTEKSYREHQERKKIRQEGSDVSNYGISIRRKNGEIRHIKVWRKEVIWNREKHIQVINQDITELKKLTTDLTRAKEKAEESNRLKTAFLNNMSHEIRTPLNGITGFINLLQDSEIDDEAKQEYFDIISQSSDRLIATVTDIMDISRIEAGEVKVLKSLVPVNEILEEQYKFFHQEAQSKGLELNYKPSLPDNESCFVTDKHKLEGILTNLIKNAIKFTETGSITFGCDMHTLENKEYLEFYVKDTGIGIPADRIEAIFNRFEQADIADTRAFQGSGLGLAIAKSYVEMLGGQISVKSKEGEGSTFTFSLPYNRQNLKESGTIQNNEKEEKSGMFLKNLSIIVAEDDETSQLYYKTIFKNKFKKVTYTTTGKETIKKFRENPDTDIILMDIQMPDMNGYNTTREIRKFNTNVVIIAQTAFSLSGDRAKALEAGCNDYISKPVKKEKIFEKIRTCLNKRNH